MLEKATELISNAKHITAFTGAGISVESGIPPFRGENGLWSKFDPILLDLDYFHKNPLESWKFIKEIFYDFFGEAKPNSAHIALAEMERTGLLNSIITQNIDNLHQQAGSKTVWEFHGTSKYLICEKCGADYLAEEIDLSTLPPRCEKCGAVLKPDFIFFGESIPEIAMKKSIEEAEKADLSIETHLKDSLKPDPLAKSHNSRRTFYRIKKKFYRTIDHGKGRVLIHESVKLRWDQDEKYRPKNLAEYIQAHDWPDELVS